jgi:hypothetical protein
MPFHIGFFVPGKQEPPGFFEKVPSFSPSFSLLRRSKIMESISAFLKALKFVQGGC